jgi:hypothetical protein
VWQRGRNAVFVVFDEGNGPLTCNYDPDARVDLAPGSLLPAANCYDPANFNDRVVFIAITNYGVRGVQDMRFQSHYSLLKTIEAAFGLPYVGACGGLQDPHPGATPCTVRSVIGDVE